MDIRLKRAYEPAASSDGYRVLIDRLWPRGVSRKQAQLSAWERDLAPSAELRQWFGHQPNRFEKFRRRYIEELRQQRPGSPSCVAGRGTAPLPSSMPPTTASTTTLSFSRPSFAGDCLGERFAAVGWSCRSGGPDSRCPAHPRRLRGGAVRPARPELALLSGPQSRRLRDPCGTGLARGAARLLAA